MNEKELIKRKSELKRKIIAMEWDKKRNQLHFAKNNKLEECKKELEMVENKLNGNEQNTEEIIR